MQYEISREILLKPLQLVAGAVDNKQTLAILANLLLEIKNNKLSLTGTDCEIEMHAKVPLEEDTNIVDGEVTVPARKLLDICKILPAGSQLKFKQDEDKILLKSGKSKFTLATMPSDEFPNLEHSSGIHSFMVSPKILLELIDGVKISVAQQDVRQYLNGMLLEVRSNLIRTVSTDGHRLSSCEVSIDTGIEKSDISNLENSDAFAEDLKSLVHQVIVPRKGILELTRLLAEQHEDITVTIESNHLKIASSDFSFTSKLIDGSFPDYERAIPRDGNKVAIIDKTMLREALSRASVLSTEKVRKVSLAFDSNVLKISAINSSQEQVEEEIEVVYQDEPYEINLNAVYLIDVAGVIKGKNIIVKASSPENAILIQEEQHANSNYVIMPITI